MCLETIETFNTIFALSVSHLQVLLNGSSESRLGHSTNDTLFPLPILEEENCWDAPDPVLRRNAGAIVGVELEALDLSGILLGQLIHHRRYHPARPAPWRPKLHQHRVFAANHHVVPA